MDGRATIVVRKMIMTTGDVVGHSVVVREGPLVCFCLFCHHVLPVTAAVAQNEVPCVAAQQWLNPIWLLNGTVPLPL